MGASVGAEVGLGGRGAEVEGAGSWEEGDGEEGGGFATRVKEVREMRLRPKASTLVRRAVKLPEVGFCLREEGGGEGGSQSSQSGCQSRRCLVYEVEVWMR